MVTDYDRGHCCLSAYPVCSLWVLLRFDGNVFIANTYEIVVDGITAKDGSFISDLERMSLSARNVAINREIIFKGKPFSDEWTFSITLLNAWHL